MGEGYFAGGLFIELYFHDFDVEVGDTAEVVCYFAGDEGTTVPDTGEYDGWLVVIVLVYLVCDAFDLLFNYFPGEDDVPIFHT